jgi:23S rRNA (guanosine2251-2'-O)-methyltransferase
MDYALHTGDSTAPRSDFVLPVVAVLDRLRSAYNTGNVFRVVDAVRAEGIAACGYTPCPPHEKLAKTARGCDEFVKCEHFEDAASAVDELHHRGYKVYAVDTIENAQNYYECKLQFPCAFVFGNEALGISEEAIARCDGAVCLPACGIKNSINVGNCAAVVLFEALKQFRAKP